MDIDLNPVLLSLYNQDKDFRSSLKKLMNEFYEDFLIKKENVVPLHLMKSYFKVNSEEFRLFFEQYELINNLTLLDMKLERLDTLSVGDLINFEEFRDKEAPFTQHKVIWKWMMTYLRFFREDHFALGVSGGLIEFLKTKGIKL